MDKSTRGGEVTRKAYISVVCWVQMAKSVEVSVADAILSGLGWDVIHAVDVRIGLAPHVRFSNHATVP